MNHFQTQVQISIIDKRNTSHKIMFGINNFQHNIEAIFKIFFIFPMYSTTRKYESVQVLS